MLKRGTSMASGNPIEAVFAYHERTKHHPGRYAASPGYLDWGTQPDPFRRHEGAPLLPLPAFPPEGGPLWEDLFTEGGAPVRELDRESAGQFFQDALGLSAWKAHGGERWALRANPSSGNLHPTEGYLVTGPVRGLHSMPAIYHYAPREHGLELLRELPGPLWEMAAAQLPPGAFLAGLTSIHWRESWKYGERAFRYCQLDTGHALGALAVSAAVLGWRVRLLENAGDAAVSALLGVDRQRGAEAEHPECLAAVWPGNRPYSAEAPCGFQLSPELCGALRSIPVNGRPNILSAAHRDWPVIGEVAAATAHEGAHSLSFQDKERKGTTPCGQTVRGPGARGLIRQRRSAVAMDGRTRMDRDAFYRLLLRTMPDGCGPPFSMLPWRPRVHFLLFVHRVAGLEPGLYFLLRDSAQLDTFRDETHGGFYWTKAEGSPAALPLFLLAHADASGAALAVSCNQEIAAEGVFSLGMFAEFEASILEFGPSFYRRLFWEAGMCGQVLYLEAEAAGLRGTGIGCFFDDMAHRILGVSGRKWQSLYHFTVGGPVEAPRVQTLSPEAYFAANARI